MVFHEIDSLTNFNHGNRIILYYVEVKGNESKLHNTLEAVLGTLEKKNDDLLIVKVKHDSEHFTKFQQIYKADIKGHVTLFAINHKGIPITIQYINEGKNISPTIDTLCEICELHHVPDIDLDLKLESNCLVSNTNGSEVNENSASSSNDDSIMNSDLSLHKKDMVSSINPVKSTKESSPENINHLVDSQPTSTQLQIRLSDGTRYQHKFKKEALLNEVWVFISTQYKLKDFDLKTYNHQIFSENDYEKTLHDLDLCPNGVVIVVPKHSGTMNSSGWVGPMIRHGYYQLLSKTTFWYRYIQGLFIMVWSRLFSSNSRPTGNDQRKRQIKQPEESNSNQSSYHKRSKTSTKSFGNIHTLRRNDDDSDDENNRYNGNSTQQK